MTNASSSWPGPARLPHRTRRPTLGRVGRPGLAVLLLLLAGCAGGQGPSWPFARGTQAAAAATAPTPVSADPVIAYVAAARPGDRAQVPLPNGASAEVRVLRAYAAASGRECREAVVGMGNAERTRLICGGEGGWAEARPLLRGGNGPP